MCHIKNTHQYTHQVGIHMKKKEAYKEYRFLCVAANGRYLSFVEWEQKSEEHAMFKYWNLILKLELVLLEFVKSIQTGNFQLYLHTPVEMAPWFFSLDHHHYARWLPVHIGTMNSLLKVHLAVHKEFQKSKFTEQKTNRKFSRIALDHNHEQLNAKVKGVGGAIGLTENETALQRWLACGPEISRLLDEFDMSLDYEEPLPLITQEHYHSNAAT